MSVEEFLGGVRVLQPSVENLSDPPLWIFSTPSLNHYFPCAVYFFYLPHFSFTDLPRMKKI